MPFPLSYHREVCCDLEPTLDKSLFVEGVTEELRRVGIQRVTVTGDRISFGGGSQQYFSRWNILTGIDEGEVEIVSGQGKLAVSVYLSFRGIVIATSVAIPFIVGLFILSPNSNLLLGKVSLLLAGWLLVTGGNYLLVSRNFLSIIDSVLKGLQGDTELRQRG